MTVNAITDIKKGRTGIAPTYLHTTRIVSFHKQRSCTTKLLNATSKHPPSLCTVLYSSVFINIALRQVGGASSRGRSAGTRLHPISSLAGRYNAHTRRIKLR